MSDRISAKRANSPSNRDVHINPDELALDGLVDFGNLIILRRNDDFADSVEKLKEVIKESVAESSFESDREHTPVIEVNDELFDFADFIDAEDSEISEILELRLNELVEKVKAINWKYVAEQNLPYRVLYFKVDSKIMDLVDEDDFAKFTESIVGRIRDLHGDPSGPNVHQLGIVVELKVPTLTDVNVKPFVDALRVQPIALESSAVLERAAAQSLKVTPTGTMNLFSGSTF